MSGKATEIIEQSQAEVDQLEQDSDEEEILAIQQFMGVAESGSMFRLPEDLRGLLKLRADRTRRPEAEIVYEILAEA